MAGTGAANAAEGPAEGALARGTALELEEEPKSTHEASRAAGGPWPATSGVPTPSNARKSMGERGSSDRTGAGPGAKKKKNKLRTNNQKTESKTKQIKRNANVSFLCCFVCCLLQRERGRRIWRAASL